jgi:hypothetical protein
MNMPFEPGSPPALLRPELRAPLGTVQRSLGVLSDPSLRALRGVAAEPTEIAAGLMVWIGHAAAWELDRRAGRDYPLHDPREAIDEPEVAGTLLALAALSRRFGGVYPQVDGFFRAVSGSLSASLVIH